MAQKTVIFTPFSLRTIQSIRSIVVRLFCLSFGHMYYSPASELGARRGLSVQLNCTLAQDSRVVFENRPFVLVLPFHRRFDLKIFAQYGVY